MLTAGSKTIKTNFPTLDGYTGGLDRGNISVIGAWPGTGKTALSLGLALNFVEQNYSVLYFPTEMKKEEIMRVFASAKLHIPFQKLRQGQVDDSDLTRIEEFFTSGALDKLHMVESSRPPLDEIVFAAEQSKPDVIFVDYLQRVATKSESRRVDIMEAIMGLKEIAKKHDALIVATSQFHRPFRNDDGELIPPTIFDFSESSQIEREVSLALLMWPTEDEVVEGDTFPVNFLIGKGRFGGVGKEFQMRLDPTYVRFSE